MSKKLEWIAPTGYNPIVGMKIQGQVYTFTDQISKDLLDKGLVKMTSEKKKSITKGD